ncbi:hypothetical protein AUJ84_03075 [Candidatus Pacearchaeota archaeon CG1_02_32_132]|nr:MAG: hypothetical protein AUJ84_03075 [Candidatus Pacearchaeota archaeon CG1_02_32_132]
MIIVDIETSGVVPEKTGIWQIGAVEFENSENTFLEECKIDDEDETATESLYVCGKTEEELRNENLQSQKEMLEKFFEWCKKVKVKNLVCQHPQFDWTFMTFKARKYGLEVPFPVNSFDLHSVAALRFKELKGNFDSDNNGNVIMRLVKILEFCGIPDKRRLLDSKGRVIKEGSPHNGLEDAKLEAECFSRLVYGKELLDDFSEYPIPEVLKR